MERVHRSEPTTAHKPIRIADLTELLQCEIISSRDELENLEANGFFAADLMSDVLAFAAPGAVLITGLTTAQSVHAADVAELKAILFVDGKRPAAAVQELARRKKIPLLATRHDMFEACGLLFAAGHADGRRH